MLLHEEFLDIILVLGWNDQKKIWCRIYDRLYYSVILDFFSFWNVFNKIENAQEIRFISFVCPSATKSVYEDYGGC